MRMDSLSFTSAFFCLANNLIFGGVLSISLSVWCEGLNSVAETMCRGTLVCSRMFWKNYEPHMAMVYHQAELVSIPPYKIGENLESTSSSAFRVCCGLTRLYNTIEGH